jgi:type II secretory pathway pseudopilin PulG
MRLLAAAIMFTVLALFLGDSVLVFLSDQLDRRRTLRLELAREQTRQAELQQRRDAIVWSQLQGDHQPPTDPAQP